MSHRRPRPFNTSIFVHDSFETLTGGNFIFFKIFFFFEVLPPLVAFIASLLVGSSFVAGTSNSKRCSLDRPPAVYTEINNEENRV